MTKVFYRGMEDYHDDGKIALLEQMNEYEVPFYVFVDNVEEVCDQPEGVCELDVMGYGLDEQYFSSLEDYFDAGIPLAEESMIPVGTFPSDPDDENFKESPTILFTGRIVSVGENPDWVPGEYKYLLGIKTLGMTVYLYTKCEEEIKVGNYFYGTAWLYGELKF